MSFGVYLGAPPCFFPLVCFTKDCECCADAFLGELYHPGTGTLRSNGRSSRSTEVSTDGCSGSSDCDSNVIPDMRGINCKRCEITYPGAQVIPCFLPSLDRNT